MPQAYPRPAARVGYDGASHFQPRVAIITANAQAGSATIYFPPVKKLLSFLTLLPLN